MSAPPSTRVFRLGRVEYADGVELQRRWAESRQRGQVGDALFLVEHPPVFTLGRGAKAAHILADRLELRALDLTVHETNRGGDVTYHGPGQVIGYPVLQLEGANRDVRRYVRRLEETLIRTCAAFGVVAERVDGWIGAWVRRPGAARPAKIGAVGVHLSRWVTTHGFALNATVDLGPFGLIVPCGIRGQEM